MMLIKHLCKGPPMAARRPTPPSWMKTGSLRILKSPNSHCRETSRTERLDRMGFYQRDRGEAPRARAYSVASWTRRVGGRVP